MTQKFDLCTSNLFFFQWWTKASIQPIVENVGECISDVAPVWIHLPTSYTKLANKSGEGGGRGHPYETPLRKCGFLFIDIHLTFIVLPNKKFNPCNTLEKPQTRQTC